MIWWGTADQGPSGDTKYQLLTTPLVSPVSKQASILTSTPGQQSPSLSPDDRNESCEQVHDLHSTSNTWPLAGQRVATRSNRGLGQRLQDRGHAVSIRTVPRGLNTVADGDRLSAALSRNIQLDGGGGWRVRGRGGEGGERGGVPDD